MNPIMGGRLRKQVEKPIIITMTIWYKGDVLPFVALSYSVEHLTLLKYYCVFSPFAFSIIAREDWIIS